MKLQSLIPKRFFIAIHDLARKIHNVFYLFSTEFSAVMSEHLKRFQDIIFSDQMAARKDQVPGSPFGKGITGWTQHVVHRVKATLQMNARSIPFVNEYVFVGSSIGQLSWRPVVSMRVNQAIRDSINKSLLTQALKRL
ncbi:TPA: hypothetical protein ACKPYB_001209 [Stenotrophomonas maltophilia]|uniref:hypothetical protein n=1 Tax=Stenotrophomonas TaxID=40323 RepID=UPI001AA13DBC|nr:MULTISPECIES: hypothetical protein [Stenotrophomonas]ELF4107742.1 hypothetical protein [Stenotrophomonas maltophilia]MBO1745490.1 hypothetical protein [Stenotrophomonas maltophilia]WAP03586.1 hypothetical protein FQS62_008920 [Stenotrophomonas sp. SBJS02]HEA4091043.1 hypothetical protein [Stenotrophomonas maltophilia]HEA4094954.1 hypothetical protein [Stenotrophomonas maltophilia]